MAFVNSIGSIYFRNWLTGPPQLVTQTLQVLDYPGANGHAYRIMGKRSPEFQMESIVDFATPELCYAAYQQYLDVIELGPYQLIWNSLNMDTQNTRYVVTAVNVIQIARRSIICGALNGGLVDIHVAWTLRPSPYS